MSNISSSLTVSGSKTDDTHDVDHSNSTLIPDII